MHMVGHTPNCLGEGVCRLNQAAEILMQAVRPFRFNIWVSVFRAEDDVVVQAQVRRGHRRSSTASLSYSPSSLRDLEFSACIPATLWLANFRAPLRGLSGVLECSEQKRSQS